MKIKAVTVIGANGTMGYNISGIFAAFGKCKVYMICRKLEDANNARKNAMLSVKGEAIGENLISQDYSSLKECIEESDIIFESIAENFELKLELNKKINEYTNDTQIICTGTSGLSIQKLAEAFSDEKRKNYLGVHFFNPPYSMVLCEVIPSKYTDKTVIEKIKTYAKNILYRTTVEVKDSPAFLGNRIGFQFINEAIQAAETYKYNGGIDYIDAILGPFTGRNMAPIATADFVGLDVHKAIVDNLYESTDDYAKETFRMPDYLNRIIANGNLGKKTNKGVYQTIRREDGNKEYYVYDIQTGKYREKYQYQFPFVEDMIDTLKVGDYQETFRGFKENQSLEARLCMEFMLKYAVYSLFATNLVGDTISDADAVMADGFSWVPPLALIQALGGAEEFYALCQKRLDQDLLTNVNLKQLIKNLPDSKYDFRRYFKAKR